VNDLDSYARLLEASRRAITALGDAVVGVAPHSLRAVTPHELAAITTNVDGPVHLHIAEQVREVEECQAWSGARPIEWLLDAAPVDPSWCLVHATHMTQNEITGLARSGAVAGICPITEANLGDGLFPARAFIAAGGRFGVGSDSNVRIDMTEELRLLEYGQRLEARARNVLAEQSCSSGRVLFEGALSATRALGVPCGLVVDAPADIISLKADHPALVARSGDQLLDSLIFAGGKESIADVWRAGVKVVAGGVHHRRIPIAQRYRTVLNKLLRS
jgi:formiminoglutamate deiminase